MKETLKTTTNNSVFKKLRTRQGKYICLICFKRSNRGDIYAGCAYMFRPDRTRKSWKHYRKNQYKTVENTYGEET